MKPSSTKKVVLSILSIQSLIPSAKALPSGVHQASLPSSNIQQFTESNPLTQTDRIIQKRIVGFDPKQASTTLQLLKESGIESFERDGSIIVTTEALPNIMDAANFDGLKVRILDAHQEGIRLKFAADQNASLNTDEDLVKSLAQYYQLKCDMDGKVMY